MIIVSRKAGAGAGAGIRKLSELEIDDDKDWGMHVISNVNELRALTVRVRDNIFCGTGNFSVVISGSILNDDIIITGRLKTRNILADTLTMSVGNEVDINTGVLKVDCSNRVEIGASNDIIVVTPRGDVRFLAEVGQFEFTGNYMRMHNISTQNRGIEWVADNGMAYTNCFLNDLGYSIKYGMRYYSSVEGRSGVLSGITSPKSFGIYREYRGDVSVGREYDTLYLGRQGIELSIDDKTNVKHIIFRTVRSDNSFVAFIDSEVPIPAYDEGLDNLQRYIAFYPYGSSRVLWGPSTYLVTKMVGEVRAGYNGTAYSEIGINSNGEDVISYLDLSLSDFSSEIYFETRNGMTDGLLYSTRGHMISFELSGYGSEWDRTIISLRDSAGNYLEEYIDIGGNVIIELQNINHQIPLKLMSATDHVDFQIGSFVFSNNGSGVLDIEGRNYYFHPNVSGGEISLFLRPTGELGDRARLEIAENNGSYITAYIDQEGIPAIEIQNINHDMPLVLRSLQDSVILQIGYIYFSGDANTGHLYVSSLSSQFELRIQSKVRITDKLYKSMIASATEPTLENGEVVFWKNTSTNRYYLIYNFGGVQKKVELT